MNVLDMKTSNDAPGKTGEHGEVQGIPMNLTVPARVRDDNAIFLNASMQLIQQQSEMRQLVRHIWFLVQRLRFDNHIDATAMDLLRADLLQTVKGLSLEKQEGARICKSGTLTWHSSNQGPPQTMWCELYEEGGRFEMSIVKPKTAAAAAFSSEGDDLFGLAKLSAQLAWLIEGDHPAIEERSSVNVFGAVAETHSSMTCRWTLRLADKNHHNYSVLTFQADSEDEAAAWVHAITSVARRDLLAMQEQIRKLDSADAYVAALKKWLPMTIPLDWQRNRIEKEEKQSGLTRRDSKNLSMLQVIRDIERDKYEVDGELLADSDAVVKHLVAKVLAFLQDSKNDSGSVASPAQRLMRCCEAKALSFVERILRGSSRTQSGGDVYDAIACVATNSRLTLCPISHDVLPVTLLVETEDNRLHVHMCVRMEFKVVQQTSDGASVMDWAALQGTLERTFTYGEVADPGRVVVEFSQDNM
ncbi:hypothetical protein Ae201684P_006621 [Aphanomyces euteiches]|uniref:PH domain-containing protein n=1 Tax=Aphanomyces euteiches TaxID=100861 RepID=A0A6G0XBH7_9STRA|nr:hypothetical protein Ae201684_006485 [Aphanomyces euteiches]KAH9091221.1 hypothetical protein Ae201684P_006621 [Aphanomyces euteiches]KAH9133521.1 hypothetical protein AeRB84_020424 [Aphanomyces euteiches]